MHRLFRRYLIHCLIGIIVLPTATAAMNLLVDPYGATPGIGLDAFGEYRRRYGRRAKAEMLRHHQPQVVLLGSSRVETGFDPAHPAFGKRTVVNLGFNRYSHEELEHLAAAALDQPGVELLIVGLDFFGSNRLRGVGAAYDPADYQPPKALKSRRTGHEEFTNSRLNPDLNRWSYLISTVLGPDTTSKSVQTVEDLLEGKANSFTAFGFRRPRQRPAHPTGLFGGSLRHFLTWTSLYGRYEPGTQHDEAIAAVIDMCRARHMQLILVIQPVHALHMEAIDEAQLTNAWHDWKRRVVGIVEADAKRRNAEPVPLWDFQGYHPYTTERVPVETDGSPTPGAAPGKWFAESSHCLKEVGDLILWRILTPPDSPTGDDTFGIRLDSKDLDAHLARIDADRARYRRSNPDQLAFFRRVLKRIAHERPLSSSRRSTRTRAAQMP